MKVYVVEAGDYEDRGIDGIYATLNAAMASKPKLDWEERGEFVGWIASDLDHEIVEWEVQT